MGGLYSKNPRLTVVAALYLVLLLPPYLPLLFGKTLYQGDIFIYFEPIIRFISTSIASGHLPLWNPLIFCGSPQTAISSPGLFYLPNLLFLVLPFGLGLSLSMLLHQWLLGVGTYLFMRLTTRSQATAIFSGALAALCGYMFGCAQCYTLGATFAWAPLALYCLRYSAIERTGRWHAAFALCVGMQILAGRPEIYLAALLIYLLCALKTAFTPQWFQDISSEDAQESGSNRVVEKRTRLQWLAVTTSSTVLGMALAAVSLLPLAELFTVSPRAAGLDFSEVARWSTGWFDWLQLILVQPFGDLIVANYQLYPSYPGLYPYVSSLFLGAPLLTLAVVGFCDSDWKERIVWFFIMVVFALLASGEFGLLMPMWYQTAPGTILFRYPIKLAVVPVFALILAAGFGFSAFKQGQCGRKVLIGLSIFWVMTLALSLPIALNICGSSELVALGIWKYRQLIDDLSARVVVGNAAWQLVLMSALALATVALIHVNVTKGVDEKRLWMMAILCLLPMMVSGCVHLWHYADHDFFKNQSEIADWIKQQPGWAEGRLLPLLPEDLLAPQSFWNLKDAKQNSVSCTSYERQILEPDVNMNFDIASAYGFGPTETAAFHKLYMGVTTRSSIYAPAQWRLTGRMSDAPLAAFCQITNTRYIITTNNKPDARTHTIQSAPLFDARYFTLEKEFPSLNIRIFKVNKFVPRCFFRRQWTPFEDQGSVLTYLFLADQSFFHPEEDVFIENDGDWYTVPNSPPLDLDYIDDSKVSIVRDGSEEVEISAVVKEAGFLVLSDLFYPGWEVEDNGVRKHIYRANGFQRAIWIEPGEHKVVFRYKPQSLICGIVASIAALFVVAIFLLRKSKSK